MDKVQYVTQNPLERVVLYCSAVHIAAVLQSSALRRTES
jgi:hypothetical protein